MFLIGKNTVLVKGAKNGAIYDFDSGNVYSISEEVCRLFDKIKKDEILDITEEQFINDLINQKIYNGEKPINWKPNRLASKLNLVWLEITQQCNCRCIHCYEGDVHISQKKCLSIDDWIRVIDEIYELGVSRVVVIGGEPCLHKDINRIIEYLCEKKLNTTIFTNGTCISNSLKEIILREKVKMKFSIYGHNATVHDKITQNKGSFDKLIENIKFFQKNKIDVSLAVIIMKENEKFYNQIIDFINSLQVSSYKIDVIRQTFLGNQNSHSPTDKEVVKTVMKTAPVFGKVSLEKFSRAYYNNTCWSGKMVVAENGEVLPCVFARDIVLGNVKTKSVEEILNSQSMKHCWEFTFENVENCRDCEFRFACKDCRPLASACVSFTGRNPRCTYNVYEGKWE